MGTHALLSPSSAQRWLTCTRSVRFSEQFPDTESIAAAEGTLAHALNTLMLAFELGRIDEPLYDIGIRQIEQDELYDIVLRDYSEGFCAFVIQKYNEAKVHTPDAVILLETNIDISDYARESSGTVDVAIVSDKRATVIDYKYGKGVFVKGEDNAQTKLYALGCYSHFGMLYNFDEIETVIYQPRKENITSEILKVDELIRWGVEYVYERAQLAFNGEGEFVAGAHCKFCKGSAVCKANADYNLETAKAAFTEPDRLTNQEIADILLKKKNFTDWLEAVTKHALSSALHLEEKFPGMKLVEGVADRVYSDKEAVMQALKKAKFKTDQFAPRSLLAFTNLQKLTGKKVFDAIVLPYLVKPEGKPVLVSVDDPRPEKNSAAAAQIAFDSVPAEDDLIG